MMRVLHVYSGNLYGGVEKMLVTLARHRDLDLKLRSEFALCFAGRLSQELKAAGAIVHHLGNVRVRQPQSVWLARRRLGKILESENYDVVICHSAWSQAIFGTVARVANRPLVFWMHAPTDGRHWLERWARRAQPKLVLCNSRFTANTAVKLYPHVRAEVLYCPVAGLQGLYSDEERRATRAELKTPEDALVIIQVSRMESLKGHALLLEALSKLDDIPEWVCWLVGGAQQDGEIAYTNELKALASRLSITRRTHFLGERSDVPELLNAADIYCQPNLLPEGFGITFVEALAAGLPVVTTALGGACEIVNDSCGVLLPQRDAAHLAATLRELMVNQERRDSLGKAGPARALSLCDPFAQIGKLHELLSGILSEASYV